MLGATRGGAGVTPFHEAAMGTRDSGHVAPPESAERFVAPRAWPEPQAKARREEPREDRDREPPVVMKDAWHEDNHTYHGSTTESGSEKVASEPTVSLPWRVLQDAVP